jgi:hypothetical protein
LIGRWPIVPLAQRKSTINESAEDNGDKLMSIFFVQKSLLILCQMYLLGIIKSDDITTMVSKRPLNNISLLHQGKQDIR